MLPFFMTAQALQISMPKLTKTRTRMRPQTCVITTHHLTQPRASTTHLYRKLSHKLKPLWHLYQVPFNHASLMGSLDLVFFFVLKSFQNNFIFFLLFQAFALNLACTFVGIFGQFFSCIAIMFLLFSFPYLFVSIFNAFDLNCGAHGFKICNSCSTHRLYGKYLGV